MRILIKQCNLISLSSHYPKIIYEIDILIEDTKIKLIKKNIKCHVNKTINAKDKYVLPGFINAHSHITMSLFKESNEGLSLQTWLKKFVWPVEDKLTLNDVYYFSLLGMLESLDSGVTTINDMYFKTEGIIKAARKCNINLINGPTLMDVDGNGEYRIEQFKKIHKLFKNQPTHFNIHGLYTASPKYIQKILTEIPPKDLCVHIHFCENTQEVKDIKSIHHVKTPALALKNYFSHYKLVLAHCVYLSKEDIKILKTLKASIVHCPTSNLRLNCGIADIKSYIDQGINVCIGTDGAGSGGNVSVLKNVKLALLLSQSLHKDKSINAYDGLKMITINAAKALNFDKQKGSIEIGKDADLIICDLNQCNTFPINNIFNDIIYNMSSENIDTVISNGIIVKENNKLLNIAVKPLMKKCDTLRKKLFHL